MGGEGRRTLTALCPLPPVLIAFLVATSDDDDGEGWE